MPELDKIHMCRFREGSPYEDGPAKVIAKTDERDMEGSVMWLVRRVNPNTPDVHELIYAYEDEIQEVM